MERYGGLTKGLNGYVAIARWAATSAPAASSEGLGKDGGCFLLSGTKLDLYGKSFLAGVQLTKLSD